jgi:hypothetical protein
LDITLGICIIVVDCDFGGKTCNWSFVHSSLNVVYGKKICGIDGTITHCKRVDGKDYAYNSFWKRGNYNSIFNPRSKTCHGCRIDDQLKRILWKGISINSYIWING